MEICPVGAELFHVDGRTNRYVCMAKLTVASRNFANAPKTITYGFASFVHVDIISLNLDTNTGEPTTLSFVY
jgi:hypothetical protein